MALITVRFDDAQLQRLDQNNQRLVAAIGSLSDNLAKWQAQQTTAIQIGFASLVEILGGTPIEDVQARLNELSDNLKSSTDTLDAAVQQHKKGD